MNCCNNSTRSCQGNGCNSCSYGCGWYSAPNCSNNYCSYCQPIQTTTTNRLATGYFTSAASTVAANETVPLSGNIIVGNIQNISAGSNGAILQPGTYAVEYSTTGSSASGISVGLKVNGVTQTQFTQSSTLATTTNTNVAGNGVISVTSPNSIVTLFNNGADTTTFTNTNLMIRQVI